MNLGIVQNSLKKFEEAEKSYRNAIKFRKKYPDCYYNLGRLVSVKGRCKPVTEFSPVVEITFRMASPL